MLRALPPRRSLGSYTVTRKPRSASSCAAVNPATPPPKIATDFRGFSRNAGLSGRARRHARSVGARVKKSKLRPLQSEAKHANDSLTTKWQISQMLDQ